MTLIAWTIEDGLAALDVADHRQVLELILGGVGDHCAKVMRVEMLEQRADQGGGRFLHASDHRRACDKLPQSAFPHRQGSDRSGAAGSPSAEGGATYDQIGQGYSAARGEDPRVAEAVVRGLGEARTVLNVGAGTGSYEPGDREVTAVEPSAVMIAQRPADAAPVVQASAEALPFAADSFDAAMAIVSDHHWRDRAVGMRELRRVARERVVIVNVDPAANPDLWLIRDYLPGFIDLIPECYRSSGFWEAELWELLGGEVEIRPIPVPYDCRDGFLFAYWRRPEAYLDPAVRAGISVFQLLPEEEVREALERLRRDLDDGTWTRRNAELLEREELDIGLRLVVARA
jgi:SAM-dependent methyltransferase